MSQFSKMNRVLVSQMEDGTPGGFKPSLVDLDHHPISENTRSLKPPDNHWFLPTDDEKSCEIPIS